MSEDICAREGCSFHVELVLVRDMALPAVYCGSACSDFVYLKSKLAMAPPTPETAEAYRAFDDAAEILNARTHPEEIGSLLGAFYAGS
ncbi:hypothetical protein [Streptomyces sp. SGAir0957]